MARERINLLTSGVRHTVHGRWDSGDQAAWNYVSVTVGQTEDGRWYVDATKNNGGALICRDERDACDLADKWMAKSGRRWQRIEVQRRP